jgi:hypothetical protein
MSPRRTRDATGPVPKVRLERSPTWAGLTEGDRVDVLDARERRSAWSFSAHVTNVETGETWVEVIGGRAGEQRRRSLRPDQVFPHRSMQRGAPTSAPLSVAPQLPL